MIAFNKIFPVENEDGTTTKVSLNPADMRLIEMLTHHKCMVFVDIDGLVVQYVILKNFDHLHRLRNMYSADLIEN